MASRFSQKNLDEFIRRFQSYNTESSYNEILPLMETVYLTSIDIDFEKESTESIFMKLFVLEYRLECEIADGAEVNLSKIAASRYHILNSMFSVFLKKKKVPTLIFSSTNVLDIESSEYLEKMIINSNKIIISACMDCDDDVKSKETVDMSKLSDYYNTEDVMADEREKNMMRLVKQTRRVRLLECEKSCSHQKKLISWLSFLRTTSIREVEIQAYTHDIPLDVATCLSLAPLTSFKILAPKLMSHLKPNSFQLPQAFKFQGSLVTLDLKDASFTSLVVFNNLIHSISKTCEGLRTLILPSNAPADIVANTSLRQLSSIQTLATLSLGIFADLKFLEDVEYITSLQTLYIRPSSRDISVFLLIGHIAVKSRLRSLIIESRMHVPAHIVEAFLAMIAKSFNLSTLYLHTTTNMEEAVRRILFPVNNSILSWNPLGRHNKRFIRRNNCPECSLTDDDTCSLSDEDYD